MSESADSYYHHYDQDFIDSFSPETIETAERQPDSNQVTRVSTPAEDAYIIDLRVDSTGSSELDASGVKTVYRCAMELGAFVPTPVIGPDWIAVNPFDGHNLSKWGGSPVAPDFDDLDSDAFLWDTARLTLLGYWDNHSQNCLMNLDAEFRHIDLQSANHLLIPHVENYVYSTVEKLMKLRMPLNAYRRHSNRLLALSEHLQQHPEVLTTTTDVIQENIELASEIWPLGYVANQERTHVRELPVVDDRVIPPDPVVPGESSVEISDFPSVFLENAPNF